MTIHEILAHPDYRRFAREVTACGRQIVPVAFPWRFMGLSDAEIHAADLRFDHGTPIPAEHRQALIAVVRHHERLTIEHWDWWLIHRASSRSTPLPEKFIALPTVGAGEQMRLFK